ncbi:SOS response-associated peptidase [Rhodococcus sp. HNM0569]|uniref:SOS response-associated peptidase n=1 Tax=Rhodococcus sp. HNM0569 TaxID=2716340 RepID=UPI00146E8F76|nr:SOS response-associated peptidase [Rhodococcus sp. HNM0569]NLU81931.1 SOS response-associated peptidase [Rhodococcus sp. HNM0569]
MCGRYVASRDPARIAEDMDALDETATGDPGTPGGEAWTPNWNVAPTTQVVAVAAPRGTRRVRRMRWGLVPAWAQSPSDGPVLFNARSETVAVKPAFADAFRVRRALVPMEAWYEWGPHGARGRKGTRPFAILDPDGGGFSVAALWSFWRDPQAPASPPTVSCAVVTTAAAGRFAEIHERMPLVLSDSAWERWLDEDVDSPIDLLDPEPAAYRRLEVRPVSPRVGNVRANDPDLLAKYDGSPQVGEQISLL